MARAFTGWGLQTKWGSAGGTFQPRGAESGFEEGGCARHEVIDPKGLV